MKHNETVSNLPLLVNKSIWFGNIEELTEILSSNTINLDFHYILIIKDINLTYNFKIINPIHYKNALKTLSNYEGKVIGFSEIFYTDKEPSRNILLNNFKKDDFLAVSKYIPLEEFTSITLEIYEQLNSLYKEIKTFEQNINIHLIKNLLTTLLLFAFKKSTIFLTEKIELLPKTNSQNLSVQFLQLLDIHFRTESSLNFYIDKLATTEHILKSECKKQLGIPPKEVMQTKVIKEAKRLLLNKSISVQEIAYELGYNDSSNFNKFFLKRMGITPKEYRNKTANNMISKRFLP